MLHCDNILDFVAKTIEFYRKFHENNPTIFVHTYVIFCFTQTLSSSFLYTFPSLCGCNHLSELKSRDDIPLLLGGGFDGIYSYLPMQLTDWPPVEVPLLFIGVTHISFDKNQF
jgi:hypothetical protein